MKRLLPTALLLLPVILPMALTAAMPSNAEIEKRLMEICKQHKLPGIAMAAFDAEGNWVEAAVGIRNVKMPAPVTLQDRWHLGSCTKAMTASLAAMLVDEGTWHWEMTLPELFPDLAASMQPGWEKTTLEQLLSHYGGAPANLDENGLWKALWQRNTRPPTEQRSYLARELLTRQKPSSTPGTQYQYSNAGYALIGHAMELRLGRSWEQLMIERLGTPLKMTSLGFGSPASFAPDQPSGHTVDSAGRITADPPGPSADNPAAIGPAGAAHCSIRDYLRFAFWQTKGATGQPSLITAQSFRKLHTPFKGSTYAAGWIVTSRPWSGGDALTHSGSNHAFYSTIWLAPKKNFGVVVCTNIGGKNAATGTDEAASFLIDAVLIKPNGP